MSYVRAAAAVLLVSLLPSQAFAQVLHAGSTEAALASLDARQKELVAVADVDGLAALAAPQLTINAPTNRILTREQFLAMMRDGRIGAEAFERKVESVTVSGNVGVVMGGTVRNFVREAIGWNGRDHRYGDRQGHVGPAAGGA